MGFIFYDDNGTKYNYENGEYLKILITCDEKGNIKTQKIHLPYKFEI